MLLVMGILGLVAFCGLIGYVQSGLEGFAERADRGAVPTAALPAYPSPSLVKPSAGPSDGFGYWTTAPGGSATAAAGPVRIWVLAAPAKAGTLRLAGDVSTVGLELERQRAAGITQPYAAV